MSPTDEPGHAINLLDTTAPVNDDPPPEPDRASEGNKALEGTSSDNWLLKQGRARGSTIRKEWTKHKYARFQEGRENDEDDSDAAPAPSDADKGKAKASQGSHGDAKSRKSYSHRSGRLRDRLSLQLKRTHRRGRKEEDYAVDVLYENQRGAFLCGIPLYSSKSLLNFDPSAWQTADLTDSPVDITNAQVPDPTWAWSWRCWYVDMSHDVDDEGWEYSFSFRQGFSWHGNQPWFTSFVRRRRWLRKRVRIHSGQGAHGTRHESHVLNQDYFTIHTAEADRGSSSSPDRTTYRSSVVPSAAPLADESSDSDEDEDITSLAQLLKRLKQTTVDRKKLDAFRNFLQHGRDDVAYMPERMEEIMGLFLYQTSRRQVLLELESALSDGVPDEDTTSHEAKKPAAPDEESQGPRRKPQLSIKSALDVIKTHVKELEYYSDIKAVTSPLSPRYPEFDAASVKSVRRTSLDQARRDSSDDNWESPVAPTRESADVGARIKGIPEEAHVGENVGLAARIERARKQQEEGELKAQDQAAEGKPEGGETAEEAGDGT